MSSKIKVKYPIGIQRKIDPPRVTADLSILSTPTDLPSDVYKFVIKNASSKQRSKLMEAGKYFYPKEFVKIYYAFIDRNEVQCYKREKNGFPENATAELSQSLWIAEELYFYESTDAVIYSLPKTVVWNLRLLDIRRQIISYKNFKYLTSYGDVEHLHMEYASIQYSDDKKEVPLENIFELLPKCSDLFFERNVPSIVSLEAANAHCPSCLRYIVMLQLDEKFDNKTFSSFMINNQDVYYFIRFKYGISQTYARELKSMIIKIHQAWNDQTRLPDIEFL